jgi:hypothetical protein
MSEAMSSVVAYGGSVAALSSAQGYEEHTADTTFDCLSLCSDQPFSSPGATPRGRKAADRDTVASAEKILRAFNTWAFKREQPSNAPLMLRTIADAVAAGRPVRFVLYWGKGPRRHAGEPEAQCLDFLAALVKRVAAVYAPGAAITLILTDTHAELNGHTRQDIGQYFDDIKTAAEQRGFKTCWLGQLVKAAGVLASAVPLDQTVSEETLARLTASAQKWYHGPGTAQQGALTYLRMNLIEQRVVERAFPRSIFITFNGSELRALFPRHLPIFYMYSLRRGMGVKPWFLPEESTKLEPNTDRTNTFPGRLG